MKTMTGRVQFIGGKLDFCLLVEIARGPFILANERREEGSDKPVELVLLMAVPLRSFFL